jgi:hypothetical protein
MNIGVRVRSASPGQDARQFRNIIAVLGVDEGLPLPKGEIIMAPWFHTAILATAFAGTVAVGLASASLLITANTAAPKADRLPVLADSRGYVTVETRGDGISVLNRVQIN